MFDGVELQVEAEGWTEEVLIWVEEAEVRDFKGEDVEALEVDQCLNKAGLWSVEHLLVALPCQPNADALMVAIKPMGIPTILSLSKSYMSISFKDNCIEWADEVSSTSSLN